MDDPRDAPAFEEFRRRLAQTQETVRTSRLVVARSWDRIHRTERELRKVTDEIAKRFDQASQK